MKLTVVGSSPAWPNPGGAQSGYLVEADGTRVLLDCGPGVLARLREREDWPQPDAVVITHFHLDHWGDLVPWVWGVSFGPAAGLPRQNLWVPPDGRSTLAALGEQLGGREMFEQGFEIHEYAEREAFAVGALEITPIRVLHYELRAFGFRVACDGKVIAYSGDSGPSAALVELAREADLFLCEATLLQPNPEGGTRGHLSAEEAAHASAEAGAKRLVLTHRPAERPLGDHFEQAYDGLELEL